MFRTIRTALVYLRAVCIHHQYCLVCFTCDFSVAFILRNSSPIGLRSVQPPDQALPGLGPPSLISGTSTATTVLGSEQRPEVCAEVPRGG